MQFYPFRSQYNIYDEQHTILNYLLKTLKFQIFSLTLIGSTLNGSKLY